MSPRSLPRLLTVRRDGRVLGYLGVHTEVDGACCGGVRLMPDVDPAEIRDLARTMTRKYGFLGLPQGGAKAGVLGDPEAPPDERRRRLSAFARAIGPMLREGRFRPHADMGTTTAEIRAMVRSAGVRPGRRDLRPGDRTDSGVYTALTVAAAARASARHGGREPRGLTAAIEGFGKVGAPLAGLLARDGVRVVAVSTARGAIRRTEGLDVEVLVDRARVAGSRVVESVPDADRIDREALLELPVDLLLPCARHDSIHAGNVDSVRATVVCPGANNPIAAGMEERLRSRGVLCVPDFVANVGGVLGGTMAFAGMSPDAIARFVDRHFERRVRRLLEEAERRDESPLAVAEEGARQRHDAVLLRRARPTFASRALGVAIEAHRRGLLPRVVVESVAPRWFARLL